VHTSPVVLLAPCPLHRLLVGERRGTTTMQAVAPPFSNDGSQLRSVTSVATPATAATLAGGASASGTTSRASTDATNGASAAGHVSSAGAAHVVPRPAPLFMFSARRGRSALVEVAPLRGVTIAKLQATETKFYMLDTDGGVHCVSDVGGRVVKLPFRSRVLDIACGPAHVVVVVAGDDGRHLVYGFGSNHQGQLGMSDVFTQPTPRPVPGMQNKGIVRVFAGPAHTALVNSSHGMYVLGGKNSPHEQRRAEHVVLAGSDIEQVGLGNDHIVVLTSAGGVWFRGQHRDANLMAVCGCLFVGCEDAVAVVMAVAVATQRGCGSSQQPETAVVLLQVAVGRLGLWVLCRCPHCCFGVCVPLCVPWMWLQGLEYDAFTHVFDALWGSSCCQVAAVRGSTFAITSSGELYGWGVLPRALVQGAMRGSTSRLHHTFLTPCSRALCVCVCVCVCVCCWVREGTDKMAMVTSRARAGRKVKAGYVAVEKPRRLAAFDSWQAVGSAWGRPGKVVDKASHPALSSAYGLSRSLRLTPLGALPVRF